MESLYARPFWYAFSVSPPLPSTLIEEGEEWWGRYPDDLRSGFSDHTKPTQLHEKYLNEDYFPQLGSVPKKFNGRNRRRVDMNVYRYENDQKKDVERSEYGLPVPNAEAAYISLSKYAKDIPALDAQQTVALNTAWIWAERHFGPYMQNSRVKSQEEVVSGFDMTASPGYPWTRKYAKQRQLFENWKEYPEYMEEDWERLRDPMYVAVFGNSLKEELRTKIKIEQNSIRTFTASPVEMKIHGNRLFEDMNQKFYDSHLKTASVVGFSPMKGGWDRLIRKLRSHPNGYALDESQYDSSIRAYMMWACAQFRWNMLRVEDQTPENKERLLTYYQNLINTVILTTDGVFVRKIGGNPSGSVNTISDNTIILYTLLAYGWLMTSPDSMLGYDSFDEHLALALCGDDNTWTVSDEAHPFFNAETLIEAWKKLGITTTTDSMSPRTVEELDFLSAHTVFVDNVACPLYSREKLITSLLYSEQPENPSYTLIRACALLRNGWTDPQLRGYLKEFISWLVKEFGTVLSGSEEWRQAMCQIPTEIDLKRLFLGRESRPMVKQGKLLCDLRDKKQFLVMNVIALPQRVRGQRRVKKQAQKRPRRQSQMVGPRMPNGRFRSKGRSSQRAGIRRRRKRGGGVMGAGNTFVGGKPFGMGAQNRGSGARRQKRVSNDEFIGAVTSAATGANFQSVAFACNPGNATTFPWLAGEATQWEKYRFEYLEFYFEHDVSSFATAGTTGKVILSFDYDAADSPPTSKQQMLDTQPHCDGMPNEDFGLVCNPRDLDGRTDLHYVRLAGLPGGADIRLYDVGNLNVATQGIASNTTELGELHVRYTVVFEVPILSSDAKAAPANNQVSWFQSTTAQSFTTATPATVVLGTATANGLNVVNTAGSMVPPAGNYLVSYALHGLDSANEACTLNLDFQKNAVSVFTTAADIPNQSIDTVVATKGPDVSRTVFVSANGTDAFTVVGTMTGAAGTLTGGGSCLWQAV